jgi:hypothetical protein
VKRARFHTLQEDDMKKLTLNVEELEPRIAPDGIGGTPGTGQSNSSGHGTEVSGGSRPQPEPSGR